MDKTLRNKVCDGQSVWHLFQSQDLWSRHTIAEQPDNTDSGKLFTSLMGANQISINCPSQLERYQFNVHHNFSNLYKWVTGLMGISQM